MLRKRQRNGAVGTGPSPGSLLYQDLAQTETDAFGHDDYARTLAELLRTANAPLTVGLLGPWGRGKSMVLGRLRPHLADDAVVVVFDAWRHEGHALRRSFLKCVADALESADALPHRRLRRNVLPNDLDLLDSDLAVSRPKVVLAFWRAVVALIPGALFALALFGAVALIGPDGFRAAAERTPWAALAALVAAIGFVLTLMKQVFGDAQQTTTLKRLDEPDRFADAFRSLLDSATTSRVVVVVDNLDRCRADHALETLGTIKTYLEPVVQDRDRGADALFVVAVDVDALRRHLAVRLGEDRGTDGADEYLRKFFSTTITMRELLDADVRDYARELLSGPLEFWTRGTGADVSAAQAADLAVYALGPDPRQLKQFVNGFSARMALIRQREAKIDGVARLSPPISQNVGLILQLALIEAAWPDAMELLRQRPRALPTWQEWAFAATDFEREERHLDAGEAADEARADLTILLSDAWSRFSEFLRRTDRVPPGISLRPYLTLKLTPRELGLPELEAVRAALLDGNWQAADSLISAAPAAASGYVRTIGQLVAEDRARGYVGSASAYLTGLLSMPTVRAHHAIEVGTIVADVAAVGGELEMTLFRTGAEQLPSLLGAFAPSDARKATSLIVRGFEREDDRLRDAWAGSIAGALASLPSDGVATFQDAVAKEVNRGGLGRFWGLAKACPAVIDQRVTRTIRRRLMRTCELPRLGDSLVGDHGLIRDLRHLLDELAVCRPAPGASLSPDELERLSTALQQLWDVDGLADERPTLIAVLNRGLNCTDEPALGWDNAWRNLTRGDGFVPIHEAADAIDLHPALREILRTSANATVNVDASERARQLALDWLHRN